VYKCEICIFLTTWGWWISIAHDVAHCVLYTHLENCATPFYAHYSCTFHFGAVEIITVEMNKKLWVCAETKDAASCVPYEAHSNLFKLEGLFYIITRVRKVYILNLESYGLSFVVIWIPYHSKWDAPCNERRQKLSLRENVQFAQENVILSAFPEISVNNWDKLCKFRIGSSKWVGSWPIWLFESITRRWSKHRFFSQVPTPFTKIDRIFEIIKFIWIRLIFHFISGIYIVGR
jgi:hypothetical protein